MDNIWGYGICHMKHIDRKLIFNVNEDSEIAVSQNTAYIDCLQLTITINTSNITICVLIYDVPALSFKFSVVKIFDETTNSKNRIHN